MPNIKRALYLGRFQPFHLGHLSVIQAIAKKADINEIVIVIAGPKNIINKDNPYTFEKRKRMIKKSLQNYSKPYSIKIIPDINNDELWVDYITSKIKPIEVIYTGNSWVKKLFHAKGYQVKKVRPKINISGTKLRKMMDNKNLNWQKFVPRIIISIINHD